MKLYNAEEHSLADTLANRNHASWAAWRLGYKYMIWKGQIYRVTEQGRKVESTGLLYDKHYSIAVALSF